ncbi:MAG: DUF1810 domain-containing protein [Nocardioidaceae bacterium]
MPSEDSYDLERFLSAQADTYDPALEELRRGRKQSHWMWYVFPQVAGLGHSPTSRHYALSGTTEARAYLDHPVLGARLLECARALTALTESDPVRVLGPTDAAKLRSSMTLFAHVAPEQPLFTQVLDHYFGGEPDPATLERL